MRRRRAIRTVLATALLGALATVLTSWAIHAAQYARTAASKTSAALWIVEFDWQHEQTFQPIDASRPPWGGRRVFPPELDPQRYASGMLFHRSGGSRWAWRAFAERIITNGGASTPRTSALEEVQVFTAGWPLAAMEHATYEGLFHGPGDAERTTRTGPVSIAGGITLATPSGAAPRRMPGPYTTTPRLDRFALPLLPIWPGFLLNTFLYALLLFIAWRVPGVLRRAVRRQRGRCARCGYSRDGLDPGAACPECGVGVA